MAEVSLIGIKKLFYGSVLDITPAKPYVDTDPTSGLSAAELKAFLADADTKEVKNIHGDNWSYEEPMPTKTPYTNKLTGKVYRVDVKAGGAPKITFTIGKYDYETKAALQGGAAAAGKYSAPTNVEPIYKTMVALTEDDVYIVQAKAIVTAGGKSVDNAIGLAVESESMEPDIAIESIAHIAKSLVDAVV